MAPDVEARLALLEDERQILRLLHTYPPAIDYGGDEAWADCFVEDAVFDSRDRIGGNGRVLRGREELLDFARRFSRPPGRWHKHLIVEPLIDVDGDAARAWSYFVVLVEHQERPVVWVFGRYADTLRRCDDGRWRFVERIAEAESRDASVPLLAFSHPVA